MAKTRRRWIGAALGGGFVLIGLACELGAFAYWGSLSFGLVPHAALIRVVATASTATILGFQVLYSSFLLYLLDYVGQKAKLPTANALRWETARSDTVRDVFALAAAND